MSSIFNVIEAFLQQEERHGPVRALLIIYSGGTMILIWTLIIY